MSLSKNEFRQQLQSLLHHARETVSREQIIAAVQEVLLPTEPTKLKINVQTATCNTCPFNSSEYGECMLTGTDWSPFKEIVYTTYPGTPAECPLLKADFTFTHKEPT